MKTCKTGCGKMKAGGSVKKVKKMATGGQALNKAKGFAPAQKGGSNVADQIYGIPNAGTTGPNRTAGYDYKKGGATTSRAVMESCKNGMVRDFDGKCVMERKMQKGGSIKKYPDGGSTIPGLIKKDRTEIMRTPSGKAGVIISALGSAAVGAKMIADKIKSKNAKKKEIKKDVKNIMSTLNKAKVMKKGGSLKPVNKSANPGLAKLPTAVRNNMGYMKKGGVKKK